MFLQVLLTCGPLENIFSGLEVIQKYVLNRLETILFNKRWITCSTVEI